MRTESRELLAVGIFGGRSRTGDRIQTLLNRHGEFSPQVSVVALTATAAVLLTFAAVGAFTPRWIAFAQQTGRPSFEVASVKLDKSDSGIVAIRPIIGGRFSASNVNLKLLISLAWGVRNSDISGGPGWIGSSTFDIEAKTNGNPDQNQIRLMLQSLLEDRFRLAVRRESKNLSVYDLTVAKDGPRLPVAREGNCAAFDSDKPLPLPAPGQTLPFPCGAFRIMPHDGGRRLEAGAVSMPELTAALTQLLDRSVIDKTAILETFDVHLDWIPGVPPPTFPVHRFSLRFRNSSGLNSNRGEVRSKRLSSSTKNPMRTESRVTRILVLRWQHNAGDKKLALPRTLRTEERQQRVSDPYRLGSRSRQRRRTAVAIYTFTNFKNRFYPSAL